MKKLLLTLFALTIVVLPASAANWVAEKRVSPVGEMILKKNSLPSNIKFQVVDGTPNNSYAPKTDTIQISSSDLAYTVNDNEVAYIIAYELGGIINNNTGKISTDVKAADVMGVDLMINAGYNPLASMVVLAKTPEVSREITMGKPSGNNRAIYLYDYLKYNYPTKVQIGYNSKEYEKFLADINSHIKDITSTKDKRKKFNKNQAKLKSKREKQLENYKNTMGLESWGVTYELLQSLTEPETR